MNHDDLKAGNPALTDECTAYGLKRAREIMAQHAIRDLESGPGSATGMAAFRQKYPAPLVVGEIQLAAICAEAYRAGRDAITVRGVPFADGNVPVRYPRFYDCGICGQYHSIDWDGDCREDGARFTMTQLDNQFGALGWTEVDMPGGEPT